MTHPTFALTGYVFSMPTSWEHDMVEIGEGSSGTPQPRHDSAARRLFSVVAGLEKYGVLVAWAALFVQYSRMRARVLSSGYINTILSSPYALLVHAPRHPRHLAACRSVL